MADATLEAYTGVLQRRSAQKRVTPAGDATGTFSGRAHLAALSRPLEALEREVERIEGWGRRLARVLLGGGRLLVVGNGGSAAQAQHLTGELVGRYLDDRPPFSALALHAESSSLTAIANDYGVEESFARQVRAHGRPGDILLALTTSGRSANVIAAVEAAVAGGLTTWALTGAVPNPVSELCDDTISVDAPSAPTVQEIHQIVIHLLCAAVDAEAGTATVSMTERLEDVFRDLG
ncbi:MAG: SIS domain-containing protein [Actinomycetota bacterium]|nr:SIS domain-containing protein [Actinomycetota bacterium]